MATTKRNLNRRQALGAMAAVAASFGLPSLAQAEDKPRRRKMILSFYCDDTSPSVAGVQAFQDFLDFCAEHKIAGESTCLLGSSGHSLSRHPNEQEQAFLHEVGRAWRCGIDTHMELMTHRGLFDFEANREPEGGVHEGLWLHEPAITVDQYERYFGNIIAEGQLAGIQFTGLTWPGCGCAACQARYAALRASGQGKPNPALWQALLNLARQGKFRGQTVPCFFDSNEKEGAIHQKASAGPFGVYDLMPNAMDHFGIWENNPARVNPDYYLGADGKSGILVRHLQAGLPYCIWYAHWQGLNPAKGVGWRAFTAVIERIRTHLGDQVVWMRPSDITNRYHQTGGWSFRDRN